MREKRIWMDIHLNFVVFRLEEEDSNANEVEESSSLPNLCGGYVDVLEMNVIAEERERNLKVPDQDLKLISLMKKSTFILTIFHDSKNFIFHILFLVDSV